MSYRDYLGLVLPSFKNNTPTDQQVTTAVDNWLDQHPQATTTVQDGSITYNKLNKNVVDDITDVKEDLNQKADIIISSAEGTVASFSDGAEYDAVSVIAHFEPYQEGSGDPSPDNVRPIHGWTGLDIPVTGKNLFNESAVTIGKWIGSDGAISSAPAGCISEYIEIVSNITVSLFYNGESPYSASIVEYDADKKFIKRNHKQWERTGATQTPLAVTLEANTKYIIIQVYAPDAGSTLTPEILASEKIQVELGSTATAYEPYQGTTTPISWQTEAGEVYGGFVDVTRGKVVATWHGEHLNSSMTFRMSNKGTSQGVTIPGKMFTVSLDNIYKKYYWSNELCDKMLANYNPFEKAFRCIGLVGKDVRVGFAEDDGIDTIEKFKSWLDEVGGVTIVYGLETPIEYDITPTDIKLLKGYNNVWNSAGGNNEVQYKADTKLYIDGKQLDIRNTIAPIEDGDTASQAYAVGRYFYRNGAFCKAKTAIASGAAFTLNTNYEVTSVANELYTALH